MEQTFTDSDGVLHRRPAGSVASSHTFIRPDDTTAYSAGDVVLGIQRLPASVLAGVRASYNGRLDIMVSAVPSGMTNFTLHFFTSLPEDLSALADNDAWPGVPASAADEYLGSTSAFTPADLGGFLSGAWSLSSNGLVSTSKDVYVVLTTAAAWTPAAETEFRLRIISQSPSI